MFEAKIFQTELTRDHKSVGFGSISRVPMSDLPESRILLISYNKISVHDFDVVRYSMIFGGTYYSSSARSMFPLRLLRGLRSS